MKLSTVNNSNSTIQDYVHLDDQTQPTFEAEYLMKNYRDPEGCYPLRP